MASSLSPSEHTAEAPPAINGTGEPPPHGDVEMREDAPIEAPPVSPLPAIADLAPAPHSASQSRGHTPPARASPHPSTTAPAPPSVPNPHGSPARIYLNSKVTPHLLEAVKYLAVHEPEKPLKWLAEFLQKKSEEVEGV